MSDVRREIKQRLGGAFDGHSVEVWLNETEPAETDLGAVERCERWAHDAHLVLAIVNGHPGAQTPRGLGICHLELKTAMEECPQKVLVIRIEGEDTERALTKHPDFKEYFESVWSAWKKFGATARTPEDVVQKAVQAVGQAVARMAGVPDSFGIPDARRYCGYPFRDDGIHCGAGASAQSIGPVHIVAIYKGVTEGQIRSHVGNADIAIIKAPFGYFCQDRSQAIQVGYLLGVEDSSKARQRANEFLAWLSGPTVLPGVEELATRRCTMVRPSPPARDVTRPAKRTARRADRAKPRG